MGFGKIHPEKQPVYEAAVKKKKTVKPIETTRCPYRSHSLAFYFILNLFLTF
jgi:hypothetical protein